jgi:hypothetical protein
LKFVGTDRHHELSAGHVLVYAVPRPARGAVTHHHGRYESSAVQKRYLRPRYRLTAANWRANGGGERDTDVLRASCESGLQREPSAHTVVWYTRSPTCSLAALGTGGNGLESPRAIAFLVRRPHAAAGLDRLRRARMEYAIYAHQAARAAETVPIRCDACRTSVAS